LYAKNIFFQLLKHTPLQTAQDRGQNPREKNKAKFKIHKKGQKDVQIILYRIYPPK
jgi:hypothetical protein